MAWQRSAVGKQDTPRQIACPAPELAIDAIGEPAEKQAGGSDRAVDIAKRQHGDAALAGEQHDRDHATRETAVKRHAALPELDGFRRVLEKKARVVEQYVTEAAAQDDAERHPE